MKLVSIYKLIGGCVLSACLMMPFMGFAQQYPISNQFFTNHFIYSPAYAGIAGDWKGNISYRRDWVGIEGAPVTKFINVNGPVGKGGFGVSMITEDLGMVKTLNGSISYAYHLEIGDESTFSFGLNGGFHENRLNFNDAYVDDYSDDIFLNSIGGNNSSLVGTSLDFGAGLNYTYDKATIGVSVPSLLRNSVNYVNDRSSNVNYYTARHYLIHASFEFDVMDDMLSFNPILISRFSENGPLQIEAGVLTK